MSSSVSQRFFGIPGAFDHPLTVAIVLGALLALALTPPALMLLSRGGHLPAQRRKAILRRHRDWLVLAPALLAPLLLGAFWTILGVGVLGILSYRRFARQSGLSGEKAVNAVSVLGIAAVTFAALDNWYGLYVALFALTLAGISAAGVFVDRPQGCLERTGLAALGFVLFGCALSHLGYFANRPDFRPILLLVLLSVGWSEAAVSLLGKRLGKNRLLPHTSSGLTVEGSVGALASTAVLFWLLGRTVFRGTALDSAPSLLLLGTVVSAAAQMARLFLTSAGRDLELKEPGLAFPGIGGLAARLNGLILAAPAAFHFIHWRLGMGLGDEARILTGGRSFLH